MALCRNTTKIFATVEGQKKFIGLVERKLGVKGLEEWYRVSISQIKKLKNLETDSLVQMLQTVYPHHEWSVDMFHRRDKKKASQRQLAIAIQKLFPEHGTHCSSGVLII